MKTRCIFCNGNLGNEGRCIHCGREQNIQYDAYVRKEKAKEHRNWHGDNPPMWKRKTKKKLDLMTKFQRDCKGCVLRDTPLKDRILNEPIRESLSSYAHNAWSGWMKYMFEQMTTNANGTATVPKWAVERWSRQMNTEYSDLLKEEKESDRREADRILSIIARCNQVREETKITPGER